MTSEALLSVQDLRVYFRGDQKVARAVDGIDYRVRRGETVCVVGESGCGKTVSALAILGLVPVPPGKIISGSILLEGQELLTLSEEELREIRGRRVAMVFQEPLTSLNPVFTIGDQIGEAIAVHERLNSSALTERCVELLRDVGMPSPAERLSDYPHQLSGGQRQRVMIGMALACHPDLIIADEPTTALDVTVQAQILGLFRRLQEERSLSVLYITHDLGVVAQIADWIYVMYAGIIAEQGPATEIFQSPQHPYTQGLLGSIPDRSKRGQKLHSIGGTVPDPAYKPSGCPFHPRCPHAIQTCRERYPGMCDYKGGHQARCPVLHGSDDWCEDQPNLS